MKRVEWLFFIFGQGEDNILMQILQLTYDLLGQRANPNPYPNATKTYRKTVGQTGVHDDS